MQPKPINELIFKGTHNSYNNKDGDLDCPRMAHPPEVQIDDFGVWVVELDYSVARENGIPRAMVGHDRPGHGTSWGVYLVDFLHNIRNTMSVNLNYRPVFIILDIKTWGELDQEFDYNFKKQVGIEAISDVFRGRFIFLEEFKRQHGGRYPTVPEIAGMAVVCTSTDPCLPELTIYNRCASKEEVENGIRVGNINFIRLGQYQNDWTFEYAVPPNPLHVDGTRQPPWRVIDSVGDPCDPCPNGDVWKGQVVGEHGTFRFPYNMIGKAVTRAEGTTPNGVRDPRRSGYGWTVLIRPGFYDEKININIPLTLKRDDRFPGSVVIGKPS
ncbi:hypothetical protein [Paenibacillus sp. S-12]|uniref:hypothetical protein n=1 Tax=Paenibacillus sp. S-12 TaxID=3031371 RepID=UPI0025A12C01|nr:hypothetical protein [Paenibacillus sp. S-12]